MQVGQPLLLPASTSPFAQGQPPQGVLLGPTVEGVVPVGLIELVVLLRLLVMLLHPSIVPLKTAEDKNFMTFSE